MDPRAEGQEAAGEGLNGVHPSRAQTQTLGYWFTWLAEKLGLGPEGVRRSYWPQRLPPRDGRQRVRAYYAGLATNDQDNEEPPPDVLPFADPSRDADKENPNAVR